MAALCDTVFIADHEDSNWHACDTSALTRCVIWCKQLHWHEVHLVHVFGCEAACVIPIKKFHACMHNALMLS